MKKQLLQSGRNSAMYATAWFICNLLLKTQNISGKAEWLFFSHWIFLEGLEFQWSVLASELRLQLVFFELFEEKSREAPDSWGLHKNTNCAFL